MIYVRKSRKEQFLYVNKMNIGAINGVEGIEKGKVSRESSCHFYIHTPTQRVASCARTLW